MRSGLKSRHSSYALMLRFGEENANKQLSNILSIGQLPLYSYQPHLWRTATTQLNKYTWSSLTTNRSVSVHVSHSLKSHSDHGGMNPSASGLRGPGWSILRDHVVCRLNITAAVFGDPALLVARRPVDVYLATAVSSLPVLDHVIWSCLVRDKRQKVRFESILGCRVSYEPHHGSADSPIITID